jgi:GDPmannose 4,6-dehydratase
MMWLMLQQEKPMDLVAATGKTHTVRDFATLAFREVGLDLEWTDSGEAEKGIERKTGRVLVEVDPIYYRPVEVEILCGDASKAKKELGWEAKTDLPELVRIMVKHDLADGRSGS